MTIEIYIDNPLDYNLYFGVGGFFDHQDVRINFFKQIKQLFKFFHNIPINSFLYQLPKVLLSRLTSIYHGGNGKGGGRVKNNSNF